MLKKILVTEPSNQQIRLHTLFYDKNIKSHKSIKTSKLTGHNEGMKMSEKQKKKFSV